MTVAATISAGTSVDAQFLDAYANAHYNATLAAPIPSPEDAGAKVTTIGVGVLGGGVAGALASTLAAGLLTNPAAGPLFQNPMVTAAVVVGTLAAAAGAAYMAAQQLKGNQAHKVHANEHLQSMEQQATQMPHLGDLLAARRQGAIEKAQARLKSDRKENEMGGAIIFGMGVMGSGGR